MRELINGLEPAVSEEAKRAADSLKYRDFLTVMLILKNRDAFHDNWIYIHDPSVKVGRIQNFRSWSPEMVPDPDKACYGLEYFCFEHDGLWDSKNEDLIALAQRELIKIGLAREGDILDGCVVRQKKAYPVYDDDYAEHADSVLPLRIFFSVCLVAVVLAGVHGKEQAVSTNGGPSTIPNIAPAMNEANAAENHLTLFVADDGAMSYELDSRKLGHSSGPLELNKPLVTGWADWRLVVDRILPHAEQWMDFMKARGGF